MSHTAIWVSADGALSVRQLPTIQPSSLAPGQYLVRVAYSGVNPADKKHSTFLGLGTRVAGYDAAGTIVGSGPETSLPLGTAVSVLSKTGLVENSHLYGSHQEYLVVDEEGCFPLGADVPLQVAATIPVVAATAADCLFSLLHLNTEPCATNRLPLLVWGGSSAVGNAAIQFAQAAGVWPVLVTASPRHHPALEERGATKCFDYKDKGVREAILAAVKELAPGQTLAHAIDATGLNAQDIIGICGGKDAALASTVSGPHGLPKPFAAVIYGCDVILGNGMTVPGRSADAAVIRDKVQWALDGLGTTFQQVPVHVVDGKRERLIESIERVAIGNVSFGKYVMKWR